MFAKVRDSLRRQRIGRLSQQPGLLLNSIPKSGTHFLQQLLRIAGYKDVAHFYDADLTVVGNIQKLPICSTTFATAHVTTLRLDGAVSLLLIRDPAEVVLSKLNYIQSRFDHPLHRLMKRMPVEEAIELLIVGDSKSEVGGLSDIYSRYRYWQEMNRATVLDYNEMRRGDLKAINSVMRFAVTDQDLSRALRTATITSRNKRRIGKDMLPHIESRCRQTPIYEHFGALLIQSKV